MVVNKYLKKTLLYQIQKLSFTNREKMVVILSLIEILRSIYKEMKADENDCEVNKNVKIFEKRCDRCGELLRTKFA